MTMSLASRRSSEALVAGPKPLVTGVDVPVGFPQEGQNTAPEGISFPQLRQNDKLREPQSAV